MNRTRTRNRGGGLAPQRTDFSMKGLVSSSVYDIDATQAASYGGTGQTLSNLVASPADGALQTAYNFYLGANNTATTDDPTFTGSAGDSAAYFALDGGDYFSNAAAISSFMKSINKTTGGSSHWLAFAFRFAQNDLTQVIFSTTTSTAIPGILISSSGTENIQYAQRGDTASVSSAAPVSTLVNGSDYVAIFSVEPSTNTIRRWVNTVTKTQSTLTFNTCVTDGLGISIGAETDAGNKMASGTRWYGWSAGNAFIDDAEAALIFGEYERRHARDYTP